MRGGCGPPLTFSLRIGAPHSNEELPVPRGGIHSEGGETGQCGGEDTSGASQQQGWAAGELALAFAVAPGADASRQKSPEDPGPRSGTLQKPEVVVRAKPKDTARRIGVLREFRSDFSPQYVVALSSRTGRPGRRSGTGQPAGPAERPDGVGARECARAEAGQEAPLHRSRRAPLRFWQGDPLVRSGKVAVGEPGAETPTGPFYVQSKFFPNAESWARSHSRRAPTRS